MREEKEQKISFVITTHTKESLLVSSCHYREVQSSVVWKFNYFCGNKEEEEEEEVKVVAPEEEPFLLLSYIWRGRWRLTRNAAPSFFNFFLFFSSDHLVTRLRWKTLFPLEGSLSSKREMTSHPPDPKKIYKRRSWWKYKLKKKKKVCFLLIQLNPPLDPHPNCARSVNLCFLLFFGMEGFTLFQIRNRRSNRENVPSYYPLNKKKKILLCDEIQRV